MSTVSLNACSYSQKTEEKHFKKKEMGDMDKDFSFENLLYIRIIKSHTVLMSCFCQISVLWIIYQILIPQKMSQDQLDL